MQVETESPERMASSNTAANPATEVGEATRSGSGRWETLEQRDRGYGKRMFDVKHAYLDSDYLKRGNTEQFRPVQGMNTTKFHNGFMRRQEPDIIAKSNPELQAKRASERQATKDRRNGARREFLRTKQNVGDGNGILIGNYEARIDQRRTRGRRHFDTPLSKESVLAGEIYLRQTSSRFYCDAPEAAAKKRASEIVKEGLTWEKKSSVLGIGRADMPSHGTKDNFSKSFYLEREQKLASSRQADIDAVKDLK